MTLEPVNLKTGLNNGMVFVILGNVQFYKGTERLGGSLYGANRMAKLARSLNEGNTTAKLVFKPRFEIDEQILLLACIQMQMQDSDMEDVPEPIGSGAAESSEAHTFVHVGSSPLTGLFS